MRCLPARKSQSLVGRQDRNAHDTVPLYSLSLFEAGASLNCTVAPNIVGKLRIDLQTGDRVAPEGAVVVDETLVGVRLVRARIPHRAEPGGRKVDGRTGRRPSRSCRQQQRPPRGFHDRPESSCYGLRAYSVSDADCCTVLPRQRLLATFIECAAARACRYNFSLGPSIGLRPMNHRTFGQQAQGGVEIEVFERQRDAMH